MKNLLFTVLLGVFVLPLAAQSPEAYFPFNGNALDSTGNGHHGLVMNGATLAADRFGQPNSAYFFDGVDDYRELANPLGLQAMEYTFELWLNPASQPVINSSTWALSVGGTGGDQRLGLVLGPTSGVALTVANNPGGQIAAVSGSTPALNNWYHVVGVRAQGWPVCM